MAKKTLGFTAEEIANESEVYNSDVQSAIIDKTNAIDLLPANNVAGWYNKTGSLISQANFYHTPIAALPPAIYYRNEGGILESVPVVVFFDDSNNFIDYKRTKAGRKYVIIAEYPAGATKFIVNFWTSSIFDVRVGDLVQIVESFEAVNDMFDNMVVPLSDNYVAFPESGYYNEVGKYVASADWFNTGILDINGAVLFHTAAGGSAAGILFYDSNDNFLESRMFSHSGYRDYVYYKNLPVRATRFRAIKHKTHESFVVNAIPESLITRLMSIRRDIKSLYSLTKYVGVNEPNLTFPNTGYYHINGSFVAQSGFSSTDKLPLPSALLIYTQTFGAYYVADIVLFDANADFVESIRLNDCSAYYTHIITEFNSLATQYAISIVTTGQSSARIGDPTTIAQAVEELNKKIETPEYSNFKTLYVGDSISTGNSYQWKGLLASNYNIIDIGNSGNYKPALGGKGLYPPITENVDNYSMWYLCSNQRLTDYAPDLINLFGGTNDMEKGLDLGLATDTPYLDTDGVRPSVLTWASAFKGCIEMLQRDFAGIEIIINTVMNVNYGQVDYNGTYTTGEYMARLQMEIALDYGLKCVPYYWNTGVTIDNYQVYLVDSVHPNKHGATRMVSVFAETLFLK